MGLISGRIGIPGLCAGQSSSRTTSLLPEISGTSPSFAPAELKPPHYTTNSGRVLVRLPSAPYRSLSSTVVSGSSPPWVQFCLRSVLGRVFFSILVWRLWRTTGYHGLRGHGLLEVRKSPWLPSRSRGEMAMAAPPCGAPPSAVCQILSLCVPVQDCTVEGAPGHNRGGVAETSLLARTQGRTRDCTF